MYKNGQIAQLDYSAPNTRPYRSNSESEFPGPVDPIAGYNPHRSGVNIDHHNGATSTLAFWTIGLINDLPGSRGLPILRPFCARVDFRSEIAGDQYA